jgi:hypothetical protein
VAGFEKIRAKFFYEITARHHLNELLSLNTRLPRFNILPVKLPGDTGSLIDEATESPTIGIDRDIIVYE